jgi:hypothetical protein
LSIFFSFLFSNFLLYFPVFLVFFSHIFLIFLPFFPCPPPPPRKKNDSWAYSFIQRVLFFGFFVLHIQIGWQLLHTQ